MRKTVRDGWSNRIFGPISEGNCDGDCEVRTDVSRTDKQRRQQGLKHLSRPPCCAVVIESAYDTRQCQIDIDGGSRCLEAEFECSAALQYSGNHFGPEQPRKQSIKEYLPPEAIDVHLPGARFTFQSLF